MTSTDAGHLEQVAGELRTLAPFFWSSPLYQHLMVRVADDPDVLDLAASIGRGQQRPNLLMAAVHHLLLSGVEHELGQWYASVVGDAARPVVEGAWPAFRDFCLTHRGEIEPLLATRNVQTNVVKRAVALRYGLHLVGQRVDGPVALVEVGPSAGLLLRFDRYGYDVGGRRFGRPDAELVLECEWRADGPVADLDAIPAVTERVGIDLQPVDVGDPVERRWLQALVWPEDRAKADRLDRALALAASDPVRIVEGDAIDVLDEVVDGLPAALPVVVFHSYVLGHIPQERRPLFLDTIRGLSIRRAAHHVGMEGDQLTLDGPTVAGVEAHGEWISPVASG